MSVDTIPVKSLQYWLCDKLSQKGTYHGGGDAALVHAQSGTTQRLCTCTVNCLTYLVKWGRTLETLDSNLSQVATAPCYNLPRVRRRGKKTCNADKMDWSVLKFKMSTVKFPSVQFGWDGIGLQFSRQCLMGYIHHYWVIAGSFRVLRQWKRGNESESERWVEREKGE